MGGGSLLLLGIESQVIDLAGDSDGIRLSRLDQREAKNQRRESKCRRKPAARYLIYHDFTCDLSTRNVSSKR